MAEAGHTEPTGTAPRRHVNITYVVMVAVAMVVGAGIFRSPADIAASTGSPFWFFGAWLAGGLITLTGALCFAELATMLPSAGGDYHFLKTSYGRHVAFLFAWSRFAVINTGSLALLGFVLGDYANAVWSLGPHGASWYALLTLVAMTLFNLKGLYIGQSADYAMTGLEVGGLVVVFAAGVALVIAGAPPPVPTRRPQPGSVRLRPGTAVRAVRLQRLERDFHAVRRSQRRAPRHGARAGAGRGHHHAAVPGRELGAVAWPRHRRDLAASRTPAADVIKLAFGSGAGVLTALAITMATLTSINATIVVGARTTYAAAADWPRLAFLGRWNGARGIPVAGIVSQGVMGVLLIGLGTFTRDGFATMIDYTSPVFWSFLTLSGFAVILLRWRRPDLPRPSACPSFPAAAAAVLRVLPVRAVVQPAVRAAGCAGGPGRAGRGPAAVAPRAGCTPRRRRSGGRHRGDTASISARIHARQPSLNLLHAGRARSQRPGIIATHAQAHRTGRSGSACPVRVAAGHGLPASAAGDAGSAAVRQHVDGPAAAAGAAATARDHAARRSPPPRERAVTAPATHGAALAPLVSHRANRAGRTGTRIHRACRRTDLARGLGRAGQPCREARRREARRRRRRRLQRAAEDHCQTLRSEKEEHGMERRGEPRPASAERVSGVGGRQLHHHHRLLCLHWRYATQQSPAG